MLLPAHVFVFAWWAAQFGAYSKWWIMMADANCVFCKIVAGQIPSQTVFTTDALIAFMDIGPLAEGHLLVIPRDHYPTLVDMPADLCRNMAAVLPRLGRSLLRVTGAAGFNLLVNNGEVSGQEVSHVHWHLIPRAPSDGLGYRWNPKSYPPGRMEELAKLFDQSLAD